MKTLTSLFLLLWIASGSLTAAPPDPQVVAATITYLRTPPASGHLPRLSEKREMEGTFLATVTDYPGWTGFPLKHWRYTTDASHGQPGRTAEVLLLNPTVEQLARWVVVACTEATGQARLEDARKLCDRIIGQSGAQFPVAGIVYENMDGAPFQIFGFRDGITVGFQDIQNKEARQVTDAEIKASLNRTTPLRYTGYQARLQSTTRADCRAAYLAAGGQRDPNAEVETGVVDQVFLDLNRQAYQEGWRTDRQAMLIAWARAHLNH